MADVLIKILEPADNFNLLTPDQARLAMQVTAGEASDDYLNQLIETNSDVIATLCNRVFAREKVRETWRCLGEPCDCADAASSRRIFLSHWPVREEDVLSVEVPRGYDINPGDWELDERAGRLSIFGGTAEPIVVTYWGGFELPDEAPAALRHAAMLLVSSARTAAERESSAARMAGIKMIAHKESRVTFETGGVTTAAATAAAGGTTPSLEAVKNLLAHFTRLWA